MPINRTEITFSINQYIKLKGTLNIPLGADSLVIFSHGSGSSRFSTRNTFVANLLNNQKIATLLIDLLTADEDQIFENRFDINLLTDRLVEVTNQALRLPKLRNFVVGYFGASTGAASALKAAAVLKQKIRAVVSRGGRPDLAENALSLVEAPTLLIIGSLDKDVVALNEQAYILLNCEKKLEVVKGASHLFEEPGKLEEVAKLALYWFKNNLKRMPLIPEKNSIK